MPNTFAFWCSNEKFEATCYSVYILSLDLIAMSQKYTTSEVLALIDSIDFGVSDEKRSDFEGEGMFTYFLEVHEEIVWWDYEIHEENENMNGEFVDIDTTSFEDQYLSALNSSVTTVSKDIGIESQVRK